MESLVSSNQSSSERSSGVSGELAEQPAVRRRSSVVLLLALVIAFALLGLLAFGWIQRQAPPLEAGLAPQFEIKTFDGQTLRLADLKGKPVVLNFWASWCIPCRDEAPALQAMWEKYKDQGLMVIGVDYVDTEPEAKKFMQEFGVTYPTGADVGTVISTKYKITGVPETYFITRDGRLLPGKDGTGRANGNYIGAISARALQARIEQLMAP
jgi:cytochrome c biogenesis protein CcmG/thiol:disulfide interchange protein DsbE